MSKSKISGKWNWISDRISGATLIQMRKFQRSGSNYQVGPLVLKISVQKIWTKDLLSTLKGIKMTKTILKFFDIRSDSSRIRIRNKTRIFSKLSGSATLQYNLYLGSRTHLLGTSVIFPWKSWTRGTSLPAHPTPWRSASGSEPKQYRIDKNNKHCLNVFFPKFPEIEMDNIEKRPGNTKCSVNWGIYK